MEDSLEGKRLIAPVMDEDEGMEPPHQLLTHSSDPPPYFAEKVEAVDGVHHARQRSRRYWIGATVVLCLYGFFKEFKPSEPFLTPYLTSPVKNFTKDEVKKKPFFTW